jgi:hypothetical protein
MKTEWFNRRKENVYFPLPLIGVFILTIVLALKIFGSIGRLGRFVVFYCVWCGAVAIIWYPGSAVLRQAKRTIDPERSTRRSQAYDALSLAVTAAGVFLAYEAAVLLETVW